VLATQAVSDVGVTELLAEVKRHRAVLEAGGALEKRRQARRRAELRTLLVERFAGEVLGRVEQDRAIARVFDAVADGALDSYSAVSRILSTMLRPP